MQIQGVSGSGHGRRWRLTWAGLLLLIPALVLPAGAAGAALNPDLKTLDKGPVRLCQQKPAAITRKDACKGQGRTVLRISTFIANVGRGPLEYVAVSPAEDIPEDCHGDGDPDIDGDGVGDDNDVIVRQRIYADADGNGAFKRSVDTGYTSSIVGCRYYHPEHQHYHVEAFAQFLLRSEATGQVVRTGQKISFCIEDTGLFDGSLPGALGTAFYREAGCAQRLATQGVSVGWYDLYAWGLPGQEIDVTGIPAGYYCLVVGSDPLNLIQESNEFNNDRLFRVYIDPATAPVNSYRTLSRAPGGCAPA